MKNLNMGRVIGAIIALAVVVWLVFAGVSKWREKSESPAPNSNSYYAVFLTNDQVYFGHLSDVNDNYVTLKNIYYLRAKDSTTTAPATTDSTSATDLSKLALIKLGGEVHGPKDEMQINRRSVMFYEELKDDSQVVKIINQNK